LQQRHVAEHIAFHSYDFGILAFGDCALVFLYAHHHGRPVGGRTNGVHRVKAEFVYPHIEFVPRALTGKLHGDTAVGANAQYHAWVFELFDLFLKRGFADGVKAKKI